MIPQLSNSSLVPVVIAVTGHRDLRPKDLAALRGEVSQVLRGFQSRMPNTPLIVLSGMAEGADQLVAEVALELKISIMAALPMPLEIYQTTMSDSARLKLAELLPQCAICLDLPLERYSAAEVAANEEARSWCYETLARFLAHHGQALIALWDGSHSDKRGGTSRVVHYVRSGKIEKTEEAFERRCGVVYQVVTPRLSSAEQDRQIRVQQLGCEARPVGKGEDIEDEGTETLTFAQVEANIERFNREAMKISSERAATLSRLIDDPTLHLSVFSQRLEAVYGIADCISVRASQQRRHVLGLILSIAFLGTVIYSIHGEMLGESVLLWFSFPVFVILGMMLYQYARSHHVEDRYLDARALAEALRVQFFWEMAGIRKSVDSFYLVNAHSELDWIRFSLQNLWLLHQGSVKAVAGSGDCRLVLERWVKDQAAWYRRKARQQSHSIHLRETISRGMLWFAAGWAILIPVLIVYPHRWHWYVQDVVKLHLEYGRVRQVLHIMLAVPALLAASLRVWIEQSGFEEQVREYRDMERIFETKAREMEEKIDTPDAVETLLMSLGIEALRENGRWLLQHRERPLEVMSSL